MTIITRKAAKATGLKYYFTGKPCKRGGHIDKRFVSSFTCMTCAREKAKEDWNQRDNTWKARRSEYNKQRWQDPAFRQWATTYRSQHAEESACYRKARKETHPWYFREHYAKHRDKRKRQASEWYHANAEYALERQKAYVATLPIEVVRAWGRKSANTRRAIKARVFVEVVNAKTVFTRDDGICGICKREVDVLSNWEVDHIVPISKGGPHSYANVQLSHQRCNRIKAAKVA